MFLLIIMLLQLPFVLSAYDDQKSVKQPYLGLSKKVLFYDATFLEPEYNVDLYINNLLPSYIQIKNTIQDLPCVFLSGTDKPAVKKNNLVCLTPADSCSVMLATNTLMHAHIDPLDNSLKFCFDSVQKKVLGLEVEQVHVSKLCKSDIFSCLTIDPTNGDIYVGTQEGTIVYCTQTTGWAWSRWNVAKSAIKALHIVRQGQNKKMIYVIDDFVYMQNLGFYNCRPCLACRIPEKFNKIYLDMSDESYTLIFSHGGSKSLVGAFAYTWWDNDYVVNFPRFYSNGEGISPQQYYFLAALKKICAMESPSLNDAQRAVKIKNNRDFLSKIIEKGHYMLFEPQIREAFELELEEQKKVWLS